MSYTALYRKWRPTSFEEVRGQDHIVKTLKNQINSGRIGHAYLFCGTRGTGKTSIAKIFARAVNCEHPVDGSPCGECSMCRQIAEGASLNVVEIDAASNNGVDNIREIREEVTYRPTQGKYKEYIIGFPTLLLLDGDGNVAVSDAVAVLTEYARIAAGNEAQFNPAQKKSADVNEDGMLDVSDAVGILIYYAKQASGQTPSFS